MQSKIIVGFLLTTCIASCLAACQLEIGGTAESYLCEGIDDLQALIAIPETAQKITIFNSKLPTLPGGGFTRFGSALVYLNISNSKVTEIQPGAFAGLSDLRDLILDGNNIELIKSDWIQDLPNLKTLRLYRNRITKIEDEVFDHIPRLELLDIAYNRIDHCISPESLAKLGELNVLFITGNPWPLRCRPGVIFHLENHHVQHVHTWGNTHILIAECLAHEIHAQYNDEVLKKCVQDLAAIPSLLLPSISSPLLDLPIAKS